MKPAQDVPVRLRTRRRTAAVLLGTVALAVALSAGLGAYTFSPAYAAPEQAQTAEPAAVASVAAAEHAKGSDAYRPTVTVVTPPPVVVTPAPASAASAGAAGSTAPTGARAQAPADASSAAATTVSFRAFCASASPTASPGDAGAMLAAANIERARLGFAPLAWSGSLAAAAAAWSQEMLARDLATAAPADALSHNPNRPGGENVAVVYSSAGYSQASAVARMHGNYMRSPGHCENLLNPAYTLMGVAIVSSSDGTTWYSTQNFR